MKFTLNNREISIVSKYRKKAQNLSCWVIVALHTILIISISGIALSLAVDATAVFITIIIIIIDIIYSSNVPHQLPKSNVFLLRFISLHMSIWRDRDRLADRETDKRTNERTNGRIRQTFGMSLTTCQSV